MAPASLRLSTSSSTTISTDTDTDSDATISKENLHRYPPNNLANRGPYKDEEPDESQAFLLEDDEETVGMMQRDRTGIKSRNKFLPSNFTGPLIFFSVLLLIGLSIPLISWLSSSSTSSNSSTFSSLSNDLVSSNSKNPPSRPNRPKVKKLNPTTNDLSGSYGLTDSKDFSLAFQLDGWKDLKSSLKVHQGQGIDENKVKSLLGPNGKLKRLSMDVTFNGTFGPKSSDLNWCAEDPDKGVFSYSNYKGDIILEDVTHLRKSKTGQGEIAKGGGLSEYLLGKNVKDTKGNRIIWNQFKMSGNMMNILFRSDSKKQWRHSSLSNYWIHDVRTSQTIPLGIDSPTKSPEISHASWSPMTPSSSPFNDPPPCIAFVQRNDLYLQLSPTSKPIRITEDGSSTTFNGIPDWVYEEEVFASDFTFWFSKDGHYLLYLSFDEAKVPVYEFPIYNPNDWKSGETTPYLKNKAMKYPKPGFENPVVSIKVVDVDFLKASSSKGQNEKDVEASKISLIDPIITRNGASKDDLFDQDFESLTDSKKGNGFGKLITEVSWIGKNEVLIKEMNRESDLMRVVLFDMGKVGKDISKGGEGSENGREAIGEIVRRIDERIRGGWVDSAQTVQPLSANPTSTAYLDEVYTPEGYLHIAYFDDARSSEPKFLTRGAWEISGHIKFVDEQRRKIYFVAAISHPAQRHVYEVELPKFSASISTSSLTPLTDPNIPGNYDISVDPKGAYYILYSLGAANQPPFQKVLGVDDKTFDLTLEDNKELKELSASYVAPQTVFYNITTSDSTITLVQEIRPHDFDSSGHTHYPVLIHVYGGPNSQQGTLAYSRGSWHEFLVEELGYIVAIADGRGTGMRGQDFRFGVTKQLGKLEAIDVIGSAKKMATLPYVDETRIGIWGWSYGGYLTSKVLEANSEFLSLGLAVAPVTDWRFYDSIYTERYMKDPTSNSQGYQNSSVHVTDGFRNSHFLLAQGSGDDNVHFSNSAHLLDLLTDSKVRNFRFRMFTDSDHSISTRGAYRELHEWMNQALIDWWGPGGKRKFEVSIGSLL